MDTVRTVSDTKRDFYTYHTRPINSIYRRVIEELMVEMHLLSVNVNFNYDPIFALGVVTAYERFMAGYQPEQDKESIFQALCRSVGRDPQQFRHDAEQLRANCSPVTVEQLANWSSALASQEGAQLLYETLKAIAFNQLFKYSRLFGIGLYSLVEAASETGEVSPDFGTLKEMGEALHLPIEKLSKDLELYRSNLEKLAQAREVLDDVMEADRKKRQQRSLEKTQPMDTAGS
ncbi:photosystem II biogenesis protein Psp29 [Spirulina major CS-329]|uniref:photosystem II biogenesis protein Psp29 n=1 Tax=Spirulina TaxID=1154 RepID=UPI00232BDB68|nr:MULTISPECIES: photosystem II biogenesis protein Psp29 [Spirulina]MDB9496486.1 photosystem II biogenesis protein Psp29 [Spirulina subsalsa CS-330]MDB9504739.1 photosystem II biogenesis protein Psp29 [Spirulina major CS-329]